MSRFQTQLKDSLPHLWRYAYSLTRDSYRADDLVQDCVERALRKKSQWDSSRGLKPWLMTILLNLFRDRYRAQVAEVAFVEDYVGGAEDTRWEDRAKLREVVQRLQSLPEGQRQALQLVAFGGLSYAEVSDVLGVPIGTVLSRVARARASLSEVREPRKPELRSVK
ncbi:sigma-70 family RNA polymerase sigma factor [Tropicibacter sp. R15_0]|uniref:RNA polymerase sigma factor n=1 Tax=Tropicibacter sp. R15_0 TaxID=2821101 RepID=UPI001ADBDC7D|nr:sigma-70 family RNA polymerase sigma factor [Tropicibacter sp. R15_0]MBO9465871.1 sigma-70 family RNA polymerase sigma factor [Tropicibacter sp. R15_0]